MGWRQSYRRLPTLHFWRFWYFLRSSHHHRYRKQKRYRRTNKLNHKENIDAWRKRKAYSTRSSYFAALVKEEGRERERLDEGLSDKWINEHNKSHPYLAELFTLFTSSSSDVSMLWSRWLSQAHMTTVQILTALRHHCQQTLKILELSWQGGHHRGDCNRSTKISHRWKTQKVYYVNNTTLTVFRNLHQ